MDAGPQPPGLLVPQKLEGLCGDAGGVYAKNHEPNRQERGNDCDPKHDGEIANGVKTPRMSPRGYVARCTSLECRQASRRHADRFHPGRSSLACEHGEDFHPTWRGIDFCLQAPADFSLVPTLLDQAQDFGKRCRDRA